MRLGLDRPPLSCRVRHGAGAWSHSPTCPRLRTVPGHMKERLGQMAGGDVPQEWRNIFITPPLDNALLSGRMFLPGEKSSEDF